MKICGIESLRESVKDRTFRQLNEARDKCNQLQASSEHLAERYGQLEARVREQVEGGCRCPDCQVWMDRARDELAEGHDTTEGKAPDAPA